MNTKRNLFIISLVVMMLITAVGYAAFSDTLTVNGSVGTASFNVQFYDVSTVQTGAKNGTIAAALDVDEWSGEKDKLTITLSNAKPNEVYTAVVRIRNIGASPATFDLLAYQALDLNPNTCSVVITPGTDPIPAGGLATFNITLTMKDHTSADQGYDGTVEPISFYVNYKQA